MPALKGHVNKQRPLLVHTDRGIFFYALARVGRLFCLLVVVELSCIINNLKFTI